MRRKLQLLQAVATRLRCSAGTLCRRWLTGSRCADELAAPADLPIMSFACCAMLCCAVLLLRPRFFAVGGGVFTALCEGASRELSWSRL